jgi:hypothetical protein
MKENAKYLMLMLMCLLITGMLVFGSSGCGTRIGRGIGCLVQATGGLVADAGATLVAVSDGMVDNYHSRYLEQPAALHESEQITLPEPRVSRVTHW